MLKVWSISMPRSCTMPAHPTCLWPLVCVGHTYICSRCMDGGPHVPMRITVLDSDSAHEWGWSVEPWVEWGWFWRLLSLHTTWQKWALIVLTYHAIDWGCCHYWRMRQILTSDEVDSWRLLSLRTMWQKYWAMTVLRKALWNGCGGS